MARLIDAENLLNQYERIDWYSVSKKGQLVSGATTEDNAFIHYYDGEEIIKNAPTIEAVPVRHGRWILEAHDERVNYRWNVTAECSECCDEQKEIWAVFFPNVPPSIARDAALVSAESVKLSNYCPNCGAKMDGGAD